MGGVGPSTPNGDGGMLKSAAEMLKSAVRGGFGGAATQLPTAAAALSTPPPASRRRYDLEIDLDDDDEEDGRVARVSQARVEGGGGVAGSAGFGVRLADVALPTSGQNAGSAADAPAADSDLDDDFEESLATSAAVAAPGTRGLKLAPAAGTTGDDGQ